MEQETGCYSIFVLLPNSEGVLGGVPLSSRSGAIFVIVWRCAFSPATVGLGGSESQNSSAAAMRSNCGQMALGDGQRPIGGGRPEGKMSKFFCTSANKGWEWEQSQEIWTLGHKHIHNLQLTLLEQMPGRKDLPEGNNWSYFHHTKVY
jgi:hypothetical protein